MRSRLPGKLRFRLVLLDMLIMEYRPLFAECRLAMSVLLGQILQNGQHTPSQHEPQANQQQKNDGDIHGRHST